MRFTKVTFAVLAAAASLSLTACNGDDVTAQGDSSADSSESSSNGGSGSGGSEQGADKGSGGEDSAGKDSAGQASGGQSASAGAGADADSKLGKCRADDLDITAQDSTIDGDPDGSVAVTLTNGSGKECAISGYAGVDLKTKEGSLSAKRTGEQATPGTLKDGESVSFGVNYPLNDTGGSGVTVTSLVVTPPDDTKSVTVEWPGAKTLPASDSTVSSVKVGPIGSAGQGGAN
ncbi:DUF4232 domain-containing protein [Streptomyces sp. NPDC056486]|uniref:DUF4232 domain-containing protein n=1 Tax=Streptomyces sp. NPDC056486 TaxID=3345835 RepID=UPI0036BD5EFD